MLRRLKKWMARMYQNPPLKFLPSLELCKGSKGVLSATLNMLYESGASELRFTDA